jgi:hypothetical protein
MPTLKTLCCASVPHKRTPHLTRQTRAKKLAQLASIFVLVAALVSCGGGGGTEPPPNTGTFRLSADASITLTPGSSHDVTVQVTSADGFASPVAIRVENLPTGVTITSPSLSLTPGQSGTLTFAAATSAPEAQIAARIYGSSGTKSGLTSISVGVTFNNSSFVPATINLPIIRIETENHAPIVSKEEYINAQFKIEANTADPAWNFEAPTQIRGRGNSTWYLHPKKPYKIKLLTKTSLMGMPADKEWVLLANYSDKTLLRNTVAMELSNRFGLPYAPRSRAVEVFLNGEYEGAYQLMENIKISTSRVNIPKLTSADIAGDAVTGGYLLEIDQRRDGTIIYDTAHGLPIVVQDPDPIASEQWTYISSYLQQTEDAIYSESFADPSTGYEQFINSQTFIDWYLVNEIFKNQDAKFFSSIWMYKERGGKLSLGPVWDFDLGAGNVDYDVTDDPTGWWVREGPWISRLFEDPAFEARVQARWQELKAGQIDTIFVFIDQNAAALDQSQKNNFQRWPILNVYVWPNPVITGSYEGEVSQLKQWLTTRIAWMDSQMFPQPN